MHPSNNFRSMLLGVFLLIQLNPATALPPPPEGCKWDSDGGMDCGDIIPVIGQPIEPPPDDVFGCRKNPSACLPVRPGSTAGAGASGNAGASGRDLEAATERFQGRLEKSNCRELEEQKTLYEGYVAADRHFIDAAQTLVAEYDGWIRSDYYSEAELEILQATAEMSCASYQIMRTARLDQTTCRPLGPNKPEKCRTPAPSTQELQQEQACRHASLEFNAREAGLSQWHQRKTKASADVLKWRKNLANDLLRLKMIREILAAKKCQK